MKKKCDKNLLTLPGLDDNKRTNLTVKIDINLHSNIIYFDKEKRKIEDKLLYEKIKIYLSENDVFE